MCPTQHVVAACGLVDLGESVVEDLGASAEFHVGEGKEAPCVAADAFEAVGVEGEDAGAFALCADDVDLFLQSRRVAEVEKIVLGALDFEEEREIVS